MGSSPKIPKKSSDKSTFKKDFKVSDLNNPNETHYLSPFALHVAQESAMTEMLRITHFQTIYNILLAILFISLVNICFCNYIERGAFLNLDLFLWNFGHFPIASIIWFFYFLGSFSVVLSQKMVVKGIFTKDLSLIISYIIAGIYLTSAPFLIRNIFSFPPATSAFLIMEVVRLCLKMHSFVKVNNSLSVAKSLKLSDEQVDEYPQNITLKNFFFFLWVPALIYQPSYPRIPSIRWSFVFARFAEVAMSMMYVYAIFTRSILPVFKEVTGSWAFLTRGIFEVSKNFLY